MAFIDYYKILGVDRNIPQKDVRAAYRKRAKQFHPDLHPNDPKAKAKFQALSEAFEGMLMHTSKRVASVVLMVVKGMQTRLEASISAALAMAEAASAASSKTYLEVQEGVAHRLEVLEELTDSLILDRWKPLLALISTLPYWVAKWLSNSLEATR